MAMENSDITLEHEAVDWSPFKLGQELDFHFSFFIFFLSFFQRFFIITISYHWVEKCLGRNALYGPETYRCLLDVSYTLTVLLY